MTQTPSWARRRGPPENSTKPRAKGIRRVGMRYQTNRVAVGGEAKGLLDGAGARSAKASRISSSVNQSSLGHGKGLQAEPPAPQAARIQPKTSGRRPEGTRRLEVPPLSVWQGDLGRRPYGNREVGSREGKYFGRSEVTTAKEAIGPFLPGLARQFGPECLQHLAVGLGRQSGERSSPIHGWPLHGSYSFDPPFVAMFQRGPCEHRHKFPERREEAPSPLAAQRVSLPL